MNAAVFLVPALLGGAWLAGAARQRALRNRLAARLEACAAGRAPAHDVAALPAPVERYLNMAMPAGAPPIRLAHLRQAGRLRTGTDARRWLAFSADHRVAAAAAGFVWTARVELIPGLGLQVIDSLVDGRASGRVVLMSALELSCAAGDAALNSGALHRFLAEAVWYPTALRPSSALRWQAVDDRSALAKLRSGDVEVSLMFRFNERAEVTGIHSPGRWGRFADGYRQMPWEGHFDRYAEIHGYRIPLQGEVGWIEDGVWQCVWQGRVVDSVYRR
jgi:hypothetical protein